MRELYFQVKFLSDIVLQASSNTEGKVEHLDFIPGSVFLGIAAQKYNEFSNPFDIFHSGKVRFGDAHIMIGDKQTYKVPLSYFQEKLDSSKIINKHLDSSNKQLKQIREGYITKDGDVAYIEYDYSQKSAYDKELRRSKDKEMYGYKAIKNGALWSFCVKLDDSISNEDEQKIVSSLVGKKRVGKSKSAQYGLVEIYQGGSKESIEDLNSNDEVIIYANSRLALFDENGNPAATPTIKNIGLSSGEIVWEKCQIRTSSFTPYNSKREIKDYERVAVAKGSVIVIRGCNKSDIEALKFGIGGYLSEGFGEVLINPVLTQKAVPDFYTDHKKESLMQENRVVQTPIAMFLQKRQDAKMQTLQLSNEVGEFIRKHKDKFAKVSKAQWGQIRVICQNASNENIAQKIEEFISKGIAKTKWENGKKALLEAIDGNLAFAKLLSMQMPKVKFENNNGGKK